MEKTFEFKKGEKIKDDSDKQTLLDISLINDGEHWKAGWWSVTILKDFTIIIKLEYLPSRDEDK